MSRSFRLAILLGAFLPRFCGAVALAPSAVAPSVQPFLFSAYSPELRQHFSELPGYGNVLELLTLSPRELSPSLEKGLECAAAKFLGQNMFFFEEIGRLGLRPLTIDPRHPESWEDAEDRLEYGGQVAKFQRAYNAHFEQARAQARRRSEALAGDALERAEQALGERRGAEDLAALAFELGAIREHHEGYLDRETAERLDETVEWLNSAAQARRRHGELSPERTQVLEREALERLGLVLPSAQDVGGDFEAQIAGPARKAGVGAERLPFLLLPHGERRGEPFVLLHGLGETPAALRRAAGFLRDQGHPVVAVLLSGHGLADGDLEGVPLASWREDVARAVGFARRLGDKVVLAGFSLGAILAADAAVRDGAAGLLLFSPVLKLSDSMARYFQGRLDSGKRWSSDEDLSNPYSNARIPMTAYRVLLELTSDIQRVFSQDQASGRRLGMPASFAVSGADGLLDLEFLGAFSAFHGADLEIYDPALRLRHSDTLEPARVQAAYWRLMERLRGRDP